MQVPVLEQGDIIIDGGNTEYRDSIVSWNWTEYIIGVSLPSLHEVYLKRIEKKSNTIFKDPEHPANKYFELLPSGKRYRHFKGNKRYINSTFPQAVRFLNCKL